MTRALMTKVPQPIRVAALALVLCVGTLTAARAAATVSPEYLIKAEFLYRFAMFVEWPTEAFPAPSSPITIGIVGADPFGSAIDLTVRDKRIDNRRLVVKRLLWNQDLRQCHIVFLSAAEAARIGELAQRVEGLPILIVGDTDDLARRGATVNFRVDDNQVRFDINREAATRARLKISASLLDLARIVRGPEAAAR